MVRRVTRAVKRSRCGNDDCIVYKTNAQYSGERAFVECRNMLRISEYELLAIGRDETLSLRGAGKVYSFLCRVPVSDIEVTLAILEQCTLSTAKLKAGVDLSESSCWF